MPSQKPEPTNSFDRKRILFLSLFITFLFALLFGQFFHIQITEGARWSKIADKQHYFIIKEPFKRGTFISNTSLKKGHAEPPQMLAIDIQKFHLFLDPKSIPEEHRDTIAKMLYGALELDLPQQQKLRSEFDKNSRSRKLSSWLDKETQDVILKWWLPYARKNKLPRNALFFVNDYQRSYPFGKLLGQVLHTIQDTKDENTSQAVPTGGLELYFNHFLKGKEGKRRLMRSPRNALETGEVITPPQHGANIYLTINHCLQAIAEEEIAKGVIRCKAKSGFATMMDPYTGEILAMAQYPFFSPTDYHKYFNDPNLIENTKVKAVTDANEPGSIMKPITAAVAFKANAVLAKRGEAPIFDPEIMVPTSNSHFPGRGKPLKDTHFHAFLNLNMAIQKSSNVYVARLTEKIIQRLGADWYYDTLKNDFGFGSKTGIELPAESSGLLPKPGKKHPNGALEWSKGTPYTLAMGHNIQTTSVQMLRAHATFANGGYFVTPTLVRKIVQPQPDGTEIVLLDNTLPERRKAFPRVITEKSAKDVLTAMKYTTKNGGSARRAEIWGYTDAGKTGTADKAINGIYNPKFVCGSFIGIAPASNPVFVLIITMEEPEYGYKPGIGRLHLGSNCAAPVFREIGTRALEYLGIPPDDPHGYPESDPRYDALKADWIPEIKRLQEMYEKWNMHKPKS